MCYDVIPRPGLRQNFVTTKSKLIDISNRYMEDKGANAPGSVSLTSGLSKPFRRLERYPSILRELERHIMASLFFFLICNTNMKHSGGMLSEINVYLTSSRILICIDFALLALGLPREDV